jgi:hypothetical protein
MSPHQDSRPSHEQAARADREVLLRARPSGAEGKEPAAAIGGALEEVPDDHAEVTPDQVRRDAVPRPAVTSGTSSDSISLNSGGRS